MKKILQSGTILILLTIFQGITITSIAQNSDPFRVQELNSNEVPKTYSFFQSLTQDHRHSQASHERICIIHTPSIEKLYKNFSTLLEIEIPLENEQEVKYRYTEFDFFDTDFQVNLVDESGSQQIVIDRGIHLKGLVKDHVNSFSSLSIFKTGIYGMAKSVKGQDFSIMPVPGQHNNQLKCIISDDSKLDWSKYPTACSTDDIEHYMGHELNVNSRNSDNCKVISISVDVDFDLFIKFHKNAQSVSNYVIGLFNNVHTLYKREGISISLNQINIHTSEDNFTHISASSDLENFRRKFPNTNKTVKLLLSGYSRNNTAPLGGIGYINTLCLQSYSYAYANVNGSYTDAPVYSWDVFLATHELGHVFGSRHTHACVWGPAKNQAIDNCAKLEGSCASPGIPQKGTIMSYCYSSGMPGIDFASGFGKEPGDLIRSIVASSNCLNSSSPSNNTLDQSNTSITANTECTEGSYTHYYFDNNTIDPNDDILVLSVDKKGNDIGRIGEIGFSVKMVTTKNYGSSKPTNITATYLEQGNELNVINKYWEISSSKKAVSPISIQYPIHPKDVEDLFGKNQSELLQQAILFNVIKPGNINPETNHKNTGSGDFISYSNSSKPALNSFTINQSSSGIYILELLSLKFDNTGLGSIKGKTNPEPKSPFTELNHFTAVASGPDNNIDFQTPYENSCSYFVIEMSSNGQSFDSMTRVNAVGSTSTISKYNYKHLSKSNNKVYYRIKAVSVSKEFIYSSTITLINDYQEDPVTGLEETLVIYPNPITNGKIQFKFDNTSSPQTILLQILDAYGRTEKMFVQVANSGINQYSIDALGLKPGLHYLNVMTRYGNFKMGFSIN